MYPHRLVGLLWLHQVTILYYSYNILLEPSIVAIFTMFYMAFFVTIISIDTIVTVTTMVTLNVFMIYADWEMSLCSTPVSYSIQYSPHLTGELFWRIPFFIKTTLKYDYCINALTFTMILIIGPFLLLCTSLWSFFTQRYHVFKRLPHCTIKHLNNFQYIFIKNCYANTVLCGILPFKW